MRTGMNFGLLILGTSLTFSTAVGQPPNQGQLPNQGQQPASTSSYPAANEPLSGGSTSEKTGSAGDTMGHAMAQQLDKRFLQQVAQNSMAGVALGKLAQEKASNEAVKQFAAKMVQDHSRATQIVQRVATRDGVSLATAMDSKHQDRVDKLAKLSGPEFDRAYIKDQLKSHERMVSYYQNEADNGTETGARKLATNMLPAVQDHLNSVKELNKTVSASAMK